MDAESYREAYRGTALSRPGRDAMLRNLCVGLGNSGEPGAAAVLRRCLADESELVRENRPMSLLIDANSAEEVTVEKLPDEYIRRQLASLENGEVVSLPFALTGRVRTEEDGYLRFEQKGHLYPVPGRPGQFRSAVTQAQDLRREEQL